MRNDDLESVANGLCTLHELKPILGLYPGKEAGILLYARGWVRQGHPSPPLRTSFSPFTRALRKR